MSKVRTCFWFDGNGAAAAQFYVSLLPNSVIETEYPAGTEPLMVNFRLAGVPYAALNGGGARRVDTRRVDDGHDQDRYCRA